MILLGILPGIACYYAYYAGRFEKRRVGVSGLEELALFIFFAIPIDTAAYLTCRLFGIELDLNIVAHLLAGSLPDGTIAQLVQTLRENMVLTVTIYFCTIVGSFLLATVARRVVWAYRIDTVVPLVRQRHPWWYIFQGRDRRLPKTVLAFVDILCEHAEDKTRIYRGLVTDFDMTPDGKLESLILRGTKRGKGRGKDFEWSAIPSDHFVVMGSTIHSINVTYFEVHPAQESDRIGSGVVVPSETAPAPPASAAEGPAPTQDA